MREDFKKYRKRILLSVAVLLPAVLVGLYLLTYTLDDACAIAVNEQCVELERAETSEQQAQGLSGRQSMAETEGMLFVFDRDDYHCMWMKDMNFALDMVWLDESRRIVDIERNVQPETYPEDFCSGEPARFVVELNSGVAKKAGLEIGQKLNP